MRLLWLSCLITYLWAQVSPYELSLSAEDYNQVLLAQQYMEEEEYQKALDLFLKVAQKTTPHNTPFLYLSIAKAFAQSGKAQEGIRYFQKVYKKHRHFVPLVAQAYLHHTMGNLSKTKELLSQAITMVQDKKNMFVLYDLLVHLRYWNYALQAIDHYETQTGDLITFVKHKALLLWQTQDRKAAITLLLERLKKRLIAVKTLQEFIDNHLDTTQQTILPIETAFVQYLQKHPKDITVRNLLYNFYCQTAQWEKAWMQAKALERHQKNQNGYYILDLAQQLYQHQRYKKALEVLNTLERYRPDETYKLKSILLKSRIYFAQLQQHYPPDSQQIKQFIQFAETQLDRYGNHNLMLPLYKLLSQVYNQYLHQPQKALTWLEKAMMQLSLTPLEGAKLLLAIGDLYLLLGDYAQAKVLYKRVEEDFKHSPLGAEAKLRFAQLAYYQGQFELAKERARSLKSLTEEYVANDAMRLYLLIQDHIGIDTNQTPLKLFAKAQLYARQHLYDSALYWLDSLSQTFPNHPIQDDVLWQKGVIFQELKQPQQSLYYFNTLLEKYPGSIWADEALYRKALIMEEMGDYETARKSYLQLLKNYRDSIYFPLAQQRIRKLPKKVQP